MVGYALAAGYPDRITKWVVIDAPLPGVGNWAAQLSNPKSWHFNFYGPDEERLVAGRERIYLDRFWDELSADPHDAFEQFKAFPQDGVDGRALLAEGKLKMPVLALGGEKSYGAGMATELEFVASNVKGGVTPNSGHWIMEENPAATTKLITS
jgi:pimeloyl-ACP methyl ester carboxylesterase